MEKIRVGVIGVGNMGERHCRVFSTMSQVTLAGISDLAEERGRAIQEKYETHYYSNFHDLLPNVDAVSIATTTPGHYPLALECLKQGKHLLVEKPIALNVMQAREMVEKAEENNCTLMIGHIERYNPAFEELKSLLDARQDEETVAINIRRLSPFDSSQTDVDVVLDLMIHDLDLVLKLTGRLPDAIETFGRSVFTRTIDHAIATLYYHDGPVVSLTASRVTQQKVRAIEITSKESYIETDLLHKTLSIHRRFVPHYTNQEAPKYRQEGFIERIFVPATEPLMLELSDFVQSLRKGTTPQVTGHDGMAALALAVEIRNKILESHRSVERKLEAQELFSQIKVLSNPVLRLNRPQAITNEKQILAG
jgi:predicted dehydrogenase